MHPKVAQPDTVGTAEQVELAERLGRDPGGFESILTHLVEGSAVRRRSWPEGRFVFRQVPSEVPAAIVPKMSSLPDGVKEIFGEKELHYRGQLALATPGGDGSYYITSYQLSGIDLLAPDWGLYSNIMDTKEPTIITPTIGRVVHFFPGKGSESLFNTHEGDPCPAIITAVWGDRCINVAVFDPNGNPVPDPPTSVQLQQPGDPAAPPELHRCEWMPYQVKKSTGSESGEPAAGSETI